jgi:hypothetical protein
MTQTGPHGVIAVMHNAAPTAPRRFWRSPPSDLPNRHGGRAAGHQKEVRRHVVELDPRRDASCQADPAEGRIDEGQQLAARAAVLILNAVSDALDMAREHAREIGPA